MLETVTRWWDDYTPLDKGNSQYGGSWNGENVDKMCRVILQPIDVRRVRTNILKSSDREEGLSLM